MTKKPPKWQDTIRDTKLFLELVSSEEVRALIVKANREYLHWDKFRFQPLPRGVTAEAAWAYLKMIRRGSQESIGIRDEHGTEFSIYLTKEINRDLSYIDTNTSGSIASGEAMPDAANTDRMVINGLMEEAISSSQIEGANTTRKVAKAMIELNRPPNNKSELMILNNYKAMRQIEEWTHRELDNDFLLELHEILTQGTLESEADEGKFRTDDDEVVIVENPSGEIIHRPPKIDDAHVQLKQLYAFANDNDDANFIHPFVKASILHFCLGYIHPFVDGNGRLARAIFYWYLVKKNYWMFKFLPLSLQIKKPKWKPGYYRAFKHVETDQGDLTYFVAYKLKVARGAIEALFEYVRKKNAQAEKMRRVLAAAESLNPRQLDIVDLLSRNPTAEIDFESYRQRSRIAYQTARTDLFALQASKILKSIKRGRKYVFMRGDNFPAPPKA